MKGKYLITTDNWFYAPDGGTYRAVWGEVEILSDSILGVKTNARSTNWFAKVGSDEKHVIVAGCQIHYAIKCEQRPEINRMPQWSASAEAGIKEYETPTVVYIAE